jgi:hypothetical protein
VSTWSHVLFRVVGNWRRHDSGEAYCGMPSVTAQVVAIVVDAAVSLSARFGVVRRRGVVSPVLLKKLSAFFRRTSSMFRKACSHIDSFAHLGVRYRQELLRTSGNVSEYSPLNSKVGRDTSFGRLGEELSLFVEDRQPTFGLPPVLGLQ